MTIALPSLERATLTLKRYETAFTTALKQGDADAAYEAADDLASVARGSDFHVLRGRAARYLMQELISAPDHASQLAASRAVVEALTYSVDTAADHDIDHTATTTAGKRKRRERRKASGGGAQDSTAIASRSILGAASPE